MGEAGDLMLLLVDVEPDTAIDDMPPIPALVTSPQGQWERG